LGCIGIIFIALLMSIPGNTQGQKAEHKNYQIPEDMWWEATTGSDKDDEIEYDIEVVTGSQIDVYIMTESEYNQYNQGFNFNAVVTHEKVMSAKGKYEIPDDQQYYVIVDNVDNAHVTDAEPQGTVYANLYVEYSEPSTDFGDIGMAVAAGCGIIILVVVIVMYFKHGKGADADTGYKSPGYIPPAALPSAAYPPAASPSREVYPCTHCGGPLTFIKEYDRWYCHNCQQYA